MPAPQAVWKSKQPSKYANVPPKVKHASRRSSKGPGTYTAEKILGTGSFGVVYKAKILETGEEVAIKKVYQDKRYKNRELQVLKELHHPNIVAFRHAFYTPGEAESDFYLNVVMEYMPEDLSVVMRLYNSDGKSSKHRSIPHLLVTVYSYQLFRALAYTHMKGFCHRDIKPQNILVCPKRHILKLCDFGSAKKLVKGECNVSYICSRYYRAPELIFGADSYTEVVDMWSAGCVIAELLLGRPLFFGDSGVDQLVKIIKVLGTPSREELLAMNPDHKEFSFPQISRQAWCRVFGSRCNDDQFFDILTRMLCYDPQLRLTPFQALASPYFDKLREKELDSESVGFLPSPTQLFQFSDEEVREMPYGLLKNLVPNWFTDSTAEEVLDFGEEGCPSRPY